MSRFLYNGNDVANLWPRGPSNFDAKYVNMPSYNYIGDSRVRIDERLMSRYKVNSNSNLSGSYYIYPNVSVIDQASYAHNNISVPSWCNHIKFCLWSRNGNAGNPGNAGTPGNYGHANNCPMGQAKRGRTGGAGGAAGAAGAAGNGGYMFSNSAVSQIGKTTYTYLIDTNGTYLYLNNGTLSLSNGGNGNNGDNGAPGGPGSNSCQGGPGGPGADGTPGNAGANAVGNAGNTGVALVQGLESRGNNRIEVWHMTD